MRKPSSEAKRYAPIIEGIRKNCPGLVVCASLSGRDVTDPVQGASTVAVSRHGFINLGFFELSNSGFIE